MFMFDRLRPPEMAPEVLAAREAAEAAKRDRAVREGLMAQLMALTREPSQPPDAAAAASLAIADAEFGPLFPHWPAAGAAATPAATSDREPRQADGEAACDRAVERENTVLSRELSRSVAGPARPERENDAFSRELPRRAPAARPAPAWDWDAGIPMSDEETERCYRPDPRQPPQYPPQPDGSRYYLDPRPLPSEVAPGARRSG